MHKFLAHRHSALANAIVSSEEVDFPEISSVDILSSTIPFVNFQTGRAIIGIHF